MAKKIRDEKFWQRLCAEYRRGSKSLAAVAEKHGVKKCTLSYHVYRDTSATGRAKKRATVEAFLPVHVAAPSPPAEIEIALSNGVSLRAPVGTDLDYIAGLARLLLR